MERVFDGLFHYNEKSYCWERAEKEQLYKGVRIVTITYHADWTSSPRPNHRMYEYTYPNGETHTMDIDKRDGNIKTVKYLIDLYEKRGEKGFK